MSVFLSFLWVVAFFFSLPLVQPYELARGIAVALVAGVAVVTVARMLAAGRGMPRLYDGGILGLVAGAFWALAGLSVIFSPVWTVSFPAFCTFSLLPLSVLFFMTVPDPGRALRLAACGVGVIFALLALLALGQYLFVPDMLVHGQVRYPFANPNSYAALLAAGLLPALAGVLTAGAVRVRVRVLAAGLAVLLVIALVVIGGRAVMVLALSGAAMMVLMVPGVTGRERLALAGLVCGALGAGILLALAGGDMAGLARGVTNAAEGAGLFGRVPIWRAAWMMAGDHPLLGTGIGTFHLYYPQYRLAADVASGGLMAHNDPLQFWAEMGTAAPVLFYLFIGLAVVRMARAWARRSVMGVALFCGLGILVAHSHVDFDFYVASILCVAGVMLAAWARETAAQDAAEDTGGGIIAGALPWRLPPAVAWGMTAGPVVAGLLLLGMILAGEMQVRRAQAYGAAGDLARFGAAVNAAGQWSGGLSARAYVMAATVPLGMLESPADLPPAERAALRAQAEGLLARAAALNPRMVAVPYYRAQMAEDDAAAEGFLVAALRLNPQHLPSRMMLRDLWHRTGRKEEAYLLLRAGLVWSYPAYDAVDYYEITAVGALLRLDRDGYDWAMAAQRRHETMTRRAGAAAADGLPLP